MLNKKEKRVYVLINSNIEQYPSIDFFTGRGNAANFLKNAVNLMFIMNLLLEYSDFFSMRAVPVMSWLRHYDYRPQQCTQHEQLLEIRKQRTRLIEREWLYSRQKRVRYISGIDSHKKLLTFVFHLHKTLHYGRLYVLHFSRKDLCVCLVVLGHVWCLTSAYTQTRDNIQRSF